MLAQLPNQENNSTRNRLMFGILAQGGIFYSFTRDRLMEYLEFYSDWIAMYIVVTFGVSLAVIHYFSKKPGTNQIELNSALVDVLNIALNFLGAILIAIIFPSVKIRVVVFFLVLLVRFFSFFSSWMFQKIPDSMKASSYKPKYSSNKKFFTPKSNRQYNEDEDFHYNSRDFGRASLGNDSLRRRSNRDRSPVQDRTGSRRKSSANAPRSTGSRYKPRYDRTPSRYAATPAYEEEEEQPTPLSRRLGGGRFLTPEEYESIGEETTRREIRKSTPNMLKWLEENHHRIVLRKNYDYEEEDEQGDDDERSQSQEDENEEEQTED